MINWYGYLFQFDNMYFQWPDPFVIFLADRTSGCGSVGHVSGSVSVKNVFKEPEHWMA
jgi:hypothetical protein